jgi:hypothetical protein
MPKFRFEYAQNVDTVFALITDREALTRRCEALGETNIEVDVVDGDGSKAVTIVRDVEQELPGFAKKLFKPKNKLVEREQWRTGGAEKTAAGRLDIVGTGGKIESTIRLSPSGSGCVYEIDFQAHAKVPLIRKKLEGFIEDTALESLRAQHEHYKAVLTK